MEDYLEAIFTLSEEKRIVRVKDIAQRLGVKMPTVTNMLKTLGQQGFIDYEKYEYLELTKKGRAALRDMGIDTSSYNPREGGAVHRYWVERVAQEYKGRGWQVEKEVPVGQRIIDVVATDPSGQRTGIEVTRKGTSCEIAEESL